MASNGPLQALKPAGAGESESGQGSGPSDEAIMIGSGTSLPDSPRASSAAVLLLAQGAPRGGQQGWNPELLINSLYLVAALLAAAALIALVNRWMRGGNENRQSPSDQLAHFRSLYEKGEISQEE